MEKSISRKMCIGIIVLLNCLAYFLCFSYLYLQDGDEFSSLAFPVRLAGGDWSGVVAKTTSWHGYGHVLIYAPFFKLCRTWAEMYNVCRIGSLISWIFLSLLIFYMASKYFELGNLNSLLVSLVCTLGNLKPDYGIGLSVETELPVGIIAVVSMLLLFRANDNEGVKKKWYSCLLLLLMFYSFSIHSRGIVLIISSFIVIAIELVLRKKMIISPLLGIIGAVGGFLNYRLLDNYFVRNVLTNDDGIQGSLANGIFQVQSSGLMRFISLFSTAENMNTAVKLYFSLLCGFVILSFGTISLLVVADIQYVIARWRCKEADNLEIGILFGLLSFFLMNGFIAVGQYQNVLNGDKRWLIYLRYAMPFAILIVFTGLVVIFKKQCDLKKALLVAAIINICMIVLFIAYPLQDLKNTSIMNRLSNIFRQYFYNGEKVDEYFLRMIMLVLAVCFFGYYVLRKNRQFMFWFIYVSISVVFSFSALKWHYDRAQVVYTYTDASEYVIKTLGNVNAETVGVKIYCNGKKELFPRYLRTSCPWSEIDYIREENVDAIDLSKSIVLSDNEDLIKNIQGIYKIELDDNEYLYTKNKDVYNWINANTNHE